MNRNVKLHPLLSALTWDVIFVWAISTMFLTNQKGLSYAQTISLDSILMLSGAIMCIPVQRIFQNVKSITALRVGLLGYAVFILLNIFGESYFVFALAQPFLSFGYVLIAVKINGLLTESLHHVGRSKEFEKISGKGLSLYYVLECVGAIFITYVYNWNPYSAFWVSFAIIIFAVAYTFLFKEPSKFQEKNINIDSKTMPKKTIKKPDSYFKIATMGFFLALLVYALLFRGIASITTSSYKIYLDQLVNQKAIPVWLFGYLFALARLATAISTKYQFKFSLKFGVRSLIIINVFLICAFIVNGVLYIYNPTNIVCMVVIIILCCILTALRTPNQIFINNYMQVCMPTRNMERAYAIKVTMEYLGYGLISMLYAGLLAFFKDDWGVTNLVYIAIVAVPLIISMIVFIRALCKKHAQKYTVIKDEYTID